MPAISTMPITSALPARFIRGSVIENIYTPDPLDRGLVGEWRFRRGAGNVLRDETDYGNHGAIAGAEWVTTLYGPALDFEAGDGNNAVTLGNSPIFNLAAPFVIECLFYKESDATCCIFEYGAGGGTGIEFYWNAAPNLSVWDGAGVAVYAGIPHGWHHGILNVHGATVDYYDNGQTINLGVAWTYAQAGADVAYLGAFNGGSEWLDGKLVLFRLYEDRIFRAREVANRYQIVRRRMQTFGGMWRMPIGFVSGVPPVGAPMTPWGRTWGPPT